MTTKQKTVADVSDEVQAMMPNWHLVEALDGGTNAMRAAGVKYLPKRPNEEPEDYQRRLSCSTLFPAFQETLNRLTGRVFDKPITFDDVPAWIESEVMPDADRQGRNMQAWARQWFRDALRKGISYCLVESPRPAEEVLTLADQAAANVRPYLIHIAPERVLGWLAADGKLTQIRILFHREEPDGDFHTRVVPQVRVYETGRVRVFEKNSREEWEVVDDMALGIKTIPIVPLYTGQTGFLTADPPLLELAHLNVKHWREQSGHDDLLETAQVPILALIGAESEDKLVVGGRYAVSLPREAELKYVEHTGKAIEAGANALDKLVDQMRQSGAKLLEPRTAQRTATEAREDARENNSQLAEIVGQFRDALNAVQDMVASWRGEASGGTAQVNANLDPELGPETMTPLIGMHNAGALSSETLFGESQRRGLVRDDIAWEDEQARIRLTGAGEPDPGV